MLKKTRGDDFEGWGVSEEELQGIITGDAEPKNEFERVCFDYVRAASEDPTSVPDELLQRLKEHLTPAQIASSCRAGIAGARQRSDSADRAAHRVARSARAQLRRRRVLGRLGRHAAGGQPGPGPHG